MRFQVLLILYIGFTGLFVPNIRSHSKLNPLGKDSLDSNQSILWRRISIFRRSSEKYAPKISKSNERDPESNERSGSAGNSGLNENSSFDFEGDSCSEDYFLSGPINIRPLQASEKANCVCSEEGTAYFLIQSRHDCQQSCAAHHLCKYWTWMKPAQEGQKGGCFLKARRENVEEKTRYVSGSKSCPLPEVPGSTTSTATPTDTQLQLHPILVHQQFQLK